MTEPQDERARRLAKLEALRAAGVDPYPVCFDRDHTIAELHATIQIAFGWKNSHLHDFLVGEIRFSVPNIEDELFCVDTLASCTLDGISTEMSTTKMAKTASGP